MRGWSQGRTVARTDSASAASSVVNLAFDAGWVRFCLGGLQVSRKGAKAQSLT